MTEAETKATLARAAELIGEGWANDDGPDAIGALEEVAGAGGTDEAVSALFGALYDRYPEVGRTYDEQADDIIDWTSWPPAREEVAGLHRAKADAIRGWNAWPESTREEVVGLLMEAEALVAAALARRGELR